MYKKMPKSYDDWLDKMDILYKKSIEEYLNRLDEHGNEADEHEV